MEIQGFWEDRIKYLNGSTRCIRGKNTITVNFSLAILNILKFAFDLLYWNGPYLYKNTSGALGPDQVTLLKIYHAFGSGEDAWDISPVVPAWNEEVLTTEFYRMQPQTAQFIKYGRGKAFNGDVSTIYDPRRLDTSGKLVGRIEPDDYYVDQTIKIISGTNVGQEKIISEYTRNDGKIVVDSPFDTAIDSSSEYEIQPLNVAYPTNCLEIRTTVPMGSGGDVFNNKNYREHAIFIGETSDVENNGFMLDKIHHPVIYKTSGMELMRFIRLYMTI